MNVLPCKYVFKIKEGKPKVRMAICGCRQVFCVDYHETFAPVVKLSTVRTILALVAYNDLDCDQMDVVTAFLHGDLDEDIYMEVPPGFKSEKLSGKVCKLLKSLYGLKQAPRQWYAKIHTYLLSLSLKSSRNDPCLYVRHKGSSLTVVALYVDDLLIAGSDRSEIDQLKGELKSDSR